VQTPVFDADPVLGLDRDDVVPADDLAAPTAPVVDADVQCRRAGQERQTEQSYTRLVPRYVTVLYPSTQSTYHRHHYDYRHVFSNAHSRGGGMDVAMVWYGMVWYRV